MRAHLRRSRWYARTDTPHARDETPADVAALKPSRFFDGRNWEAAFAARQASGS